MIAQGYHDSSCRHDRVFVDDRGSTKCVRCGYVGGLERPQKFGG